ncbi:MAG: hypothetical protein AAGH43_02565 [Pseudomonadota bacterium]
MKRYKIALTRHGLHWCEIIIESRTPDDALADVMARFPQEDGFALSVWEEAECSRIVEVGSNVRVLGVAYEKTLIERVLTERSG